MAAKTTKTTKGKATGPKPGEHPGKIVDIQLFIHVHFPMREMD
jgi:hypothetical protein